MHNMDNAQNKTAAQVRQETLEKFQTEWARAHAGMIFDAVLNSLHRTQENSKEIYSNLRAARQFGAISPDNSLPLVYAQYSVLKVLGEAASRASKIIESETNFSDAEKKYLATVSANATEHVVAEMSQARKNEKLREDGLRSLVASLLAPPKGDSDAKN